MKHETSQTLYRYWNRKRGSKTTPDRSDIEPADIAGILGDTFILEPHSVSDYRFRLAGTRICGSYCRDLRNVNIIDLFKGEEQENIRTLLSAAAYEDSAVVVGLIGRTEREQSIAIEMTLLPLRANNGRERRILGTLVPVESPYWLGLWPLVEHEVSSLRMIWPDSQEQFVRRPGAEPAKSRAINESPAPAKPDVEQDVLISDNSRRYGHLVVLDGGRP